MRYFLDGHAMNILIMEAIGNTPWGTILKYNKNRTDLTYDLRQRKCKNWLTSGDLSSSFVLEYWQKISIYVLSFDLTNGLRWNSFFAPLWQHHSQSAPLHRRNSRPTVSDQYIPSSWRTRSQHLEPLLSSLYDSLFCGYF